MLAPADWCFDPCSGFHNQVVAVKKRWDAQVGLDPPFIGVAAAQQRMPPSIWPLNVLHCAGRHLSDT